MIITVPEYFSRFINPKVNLEQTPKICCPFHEEDTPSFSYSPQKGIWRCFGACHTGGDVIALHMKHYGLRNRTEAERSLYRLLGVSAPEHLKLQVQKGTADENAVTHKAAYARALMVARTPDDWEELDYIMSQYPPSTDKLDAFYNVRRS